MSQTTNPRYDYNQLIRYLDKNDSVDEEYNDVEIPSDLSDFYSDLGVPTKDNSIIRIIDTIDESENEECKTTKRRLLKKLSKSPNINKVSLKSQIEKLKSSSKNQYLFL
jgi:translation elongation factor EF-Tu-like GTPase